ncbi:MAG: prepilin-type N-terminal cleavage/methylation domain-containing protein [bacterium]|nr:prepilin-type N-terminal cleavage/methylation domain-containing protein [bacterium]
MYKLLSKNKNGMTMVELMMAVAIILVVVVPLTKVLLNSMQGAMSFGDANKAVQLAQDLMEEIKQKKWDENEPAGGGQTPVGSYSAQPLGRDGVETNPDTNGDNGAKLTWDDIDDYNGLIETPPRDINNNIVPNAQKFTRRVTVQYVNVPNGGAITVLGAGTTDYKQIIVNVDWRGRIGGTPVTITTIRANVKRY